ncbi:MAG TPA: O-antigen ligase family protein [Saprospiraceae bacterium]|nr:O-antigen ligase family protein [Saprospiraceae bacterium]
MKLLNKHDDHNHKLFALITGLQLIFIVSGVLLNSIWWLIFLPVVGIIAVSLLRVQELYLVLAIVLPISVEKTITFGLSTDFPSESIMWILTLIFPFYVALHYKQEYYKHLQHPVSLLILVTFLWLIPVTFASSNIFLSVKFTLAKIWYLIVFFYFFLWVFKSQKNIRQFYKLLLISLSLIICVVIVRQFQDGFLFTEVNRAVFPFFRNHVSYAIMMGALLPYVWYMGHTSQHRWIWVILGIVFVIAIYFSYTRAAVIAVFCGLLSYWIFRLQWVKMMISLIAIIAIAGSTYLSVNNKYLDFAPDFDRTITHHQFDQLIQATYKLEDISTMERVYRWLAGMQMIRDRPFFGFGPNNFYSFYQEYASNAFRTYVSNNPDQSGIHNYYLMLGAEQGLIGMILFIVLILLFFISGQKVWKNCRNKAEKNLIMAALISQVVICLTLFMNDLIETDKIGSLFFLNFAVLVIHSVKNRDFPVNP